MVGAMKGKVIEALNREHGKKVIEYFQSKGIATDGYHGANNKADGDEFRFFGCGSDGIFTTWSEREVLMKGFEVITLPTEYPKEMLVWDGDRDKTEQTVIAYVPELEYPYLVDFGQGDYSGFQHAEEIKEPEELTLEQVCKELGRNIKIVK